VPVNWCPALGTVLANEEVVDGKSERGGHPVYRTPLRQWMLRITAYADRLAEDLALVDWPEGTLTAQRRWIGRSEGAEIVFGIDGHPDARIAVFTTRPDTPHGRHLRRACLPSAGQPLRIKGTIAGVAHEALPYRNVDISKFYPYGDVSFP